MPRLGFVFIALALLVFTAPARAGSFSSDFNSGLPDGSTVFGNASITPNDGTGGGYGNSGCLELTPLATSQNGVFIITNDLDAGQPVVSFTAQFKVFLGSVGNGADGFSFNFAPDLNLFGGWGAPEEGDGTGLTVSFDTFPNPAPDKAQSIEIKVGGVSLGNNLFPGLRAGTFVDVAILFKPNGTLDVIYDGVYAVSNLNVGFVPTAGSLFGFGARTGSVTDHHRIDDLSIVTHTNAAAFVQSFAPRGRRVPSNAAVDLVLANATSNVNTNQITLQLDGATVAAAITQDGSNTFVHFAPPGGFAALSSHSVRLSFSDDASPIPRTNSWQYNFTVAANYAVLFSDGFEGYASGASPLDMNTAGGNASANGNLAGNPWFGPAPPNARVIGAATNATPHGGTNMIRGSAASDLDENWFNLSYRLNGGTPYKGNIMLDWWFYDPLGPGGTTYREYAAIGYYNLAPNNTDYPGTGSLNSSAQIQRLCLGASSVQTAGLFDSTKYQARVVNANDGYASGWFNLPVTRSVGWHHGRVIVGPALPESAPNVEFYIDDMVNPTFTHNAILLYSGYNVIELNTAYGATFGYTDDVSFSVVVPPKLSAAVNGSEMVLSWPGLGFTLQSATDVAGPYTEVVGAMSPYTNDISANPMQFFRLRN